MESVENLIIRVSLITQLIKGKQRRRCALWAFLSEANYTSINQPINQ